MEGWGDFLLTWHFQIKLLRKLVKSTEINEKFPPLLNSSHNRGGPFKCKQMSFKMQKWHRELQSQSPPPPPPPPLKPQNIACFTAQTVVTAKLLFSFIIVVLPQTCMQHVVVFTGFKEGGGVNPEHRA